MTDEGATSKPRRKPRQITFVQASVGVIGWGLFMLLLVQVGRDKWEWFGQSPKRLGMILIALGAAGLVLATFASMRRRADR